MDNITHSLAALAVAEFAVSQTGTQRRRRMLWTSSLLANNFPDLDILYAGGKLGYLVHHRGHTHTFLLGIPQSLIVLGIVWLIARARKGEPTAHEWRVAAFLAFLGPILHISLDFLNSYGVHPFWPFWNRWFYGDAVFIVEPWLWASFAPALWSPDASRKRTIAVALMALAGPLLLWIYPAVPWYPALGVTLWVAALSILVYRWKHRAVVGLVAGAIVIATFLGVSRYIKHDFPYPVADLVLTPSASNPLCWSMLAVRAHEDEYRVRRGVYAPFPFLEKAQGCRVIRIGEGDATMRDVAEAGDPRIRWTGEYVGSRSKVVSLGETHCGFGALLRFARVPFVLDEGQDFVAGDVRYDFEKGMGFSEMRFPKTPDSCPERVPPWEWPAGKWLRK